MVPDVLSVGTSGCCPDVPWYRVPFAEILYTKDASSQPVHVRLPYLRRAYKEERKGEQEEELLNGS
jgi:hypothetical protein